MSKLIGISAKKLKIQKLIIELTDGSNTSVDPVTFRLVGWYVEHKDKIGRMTSCAKHSPSGCGFINWTAINLFWNEIIQFSRLEPNYGK